jgi:hypothetical protein
MRLYSPAFQDQATIPVKYVMPGAGGKNVSIPYAWEDAPAETKSLALALIDPHPVANNWIHWLVINIPAQATSLPEGASGQKMPEGSNELHNSFGQPGYGGPQPPAGTGGHPYVATLYALNTASLELPEKASLEQFYRAIEGKILDQAEYTGMFEQ